MEAHEERKKAREEDRMPVFPISPGMFRERTQEEVAELRSAQERERAERYRDVYTSVLASGSSRTQTAPSS